MRLIIVTALLALTSVRSPANAQAPKPPNALENTLINLERASWKAWQTHDSAFFRRFLSDDHVEVEEAGTVGKNAIVAAIGSPVCVVNSFTIDRFKITQFTATTAVLTYHAEQNTVCNGEKVPSPVWASSLYVKRSGRWLNALYQQTKAK